MGSVPNENTGTTGHSQEHLAPENAADSPLGANSVADALPAIPTDIHHIAEGIQVKVDGTLERERRVSEAIPAEYPEDFKKRISSSRVREVVLQVIEMGGEAGMYVANSFVGTYQFGKALKTMQDGEYINIKWGGDELLYVYKHEGQLRALFIDIGNMGPANRVLGEKVKQVDGELNIVDLFLLRIAKGAGEFLSKGDANGFIEHVRQIGENLILLTREEYEQHVEKYGFDESVSYEDYLETVRHTQNLARVRQLVRDTQAIFKGVIDLDVRSGAEKGDEKDMHDFLHAEFFDGVTNLSSFVSELIELVNEENSPLASALNENAQAVTQALKPLTEPVPTSKEAMADRVIAMQILIYLITREDDDKVNIASKHLAHVDTNIFDRVHDDSHYQMASGHRFGAKKLAVRILDAQGAVSRPKEHDAFQSFEKVSWMVAGELEEGLKEAKQAKKGGDVVAVGAQHEEQTRRIERARKMDQDEEEMPELEERDAQANEKKLAEEKAHMEERKMQMERRYAQRLQNEQVRLIDRLEKESKFLQELLRIMKGAFLSEMAAEVSDQPSEAVTELSEQQEDRLAAFTAWRREFAILCVQHHRKDQLIGGVQQTSEQLKASTEKVRTFVKGLSSHFREDPKFSEILRRLFLMFMFPKSEAQIMVNIAELLDTVPAVKNEETRKKLSALLNLTAERFKNTNVRAEGWYSANNLQVTAIGDRALWSMIEQSTADSFDVTTIEMRHAGSLNTAFGYDFIDELSCECAPIVKRVLREHGIPSWHYELAKDGGGRLRLISHSGKIHPEIVQAVCDALNARMSDKMKEFKYRDQKNAAIIDGLGREGLVQSGFKAEHASGKAPVGSFQVASQKTLALTWSDEKRIKDIREKNFYQLEEMMALQTFA